MKAVISRFFSGPSSPPTLWRVVAWWELRRLPFNLVMGLYAALNLAIFMWAISASGRLKPGEDAVEPLALIAAVILGNALYTLGWLVEAPLRLAVPGLTSRFAPALLKLGFAAGFTLIALPALAWCAIRVAQLAGLAQ
jgi:hypothetical protein